MRLDAVEVLARARAAGIEVEPKLREGGVSLVVRHRAGAALDDILDDLRAVKPAVVRLLLIEGGRCQGCGRMDWAIALVHDDGGRTCAPCATGASALRRAGVPVGFPAENSSGSAGSGGGSDRFCPLREETT